MSKSIAFQIKINVDGKQLITSATTDVDKLKKTIADAKEATQSFSQSLSGMAHAAETIRGVKDNFGQITQVLNDLTAESRSYSAAMTAANTMAGKGSEEFAQLKDQVTELSHTIPIARDQLANGLYQVISNGVPENNWIEFLRTSARASVGGIADLGETVKVTSTMIKNYGLDWSEAAGIQDKIQLVAKNGVTTFEEMAQALPRVASQASNLGVSVDELMASFATLTGVSGNTAEVSTQLAAIFTALIKPSSEATQMAEQMGIKFDAAAIKAAGGFQNFITQLDKDVKTYAAANGMLEQEVYGKLFGSAESLRALTPLTNQLAETFTNNVGNMSNSAGTMDDSFDKMAATGAAALQLLNNKLGTFSDFVQSTIGNALPYLNFSSQLLISAAAVTQLIVSLRALGATFNIVTATSTLLRTTMVSLRALAIAVTISFRAWRAGSITLTAALRGVAVGAATAKMAIRGLLASTGIGVALVALGFALEKLIEYLTGSADAADQETEALNANTEAVDRNAERRKAIQSVQDDAASRYSDERNKVKQLTDVIHDNTASLADRQTAIRNLQAIIPSYHASIAKDGSIFNENTAAVNSYIDSLTDLAAAEAAFDAIKKSFEQEIGIRQAYNFWNKKYAQTSDQIKTLNGDKDYVTTDTPHSNPVGNLQGQLGFHPTTPTTPTADINKGTDFNANPIAQAAHARQADRDRNKQEQKIRAQRATAQEKASYYGSQLRDLEDFRESILSTLTPGARARYNTFRAQGSYIAGAGLGAPTQAAPGKGGGHATTHTATGGANTTDDKPQQGSLKDLDQRISLLREEAQATADVTEAQEKLAQAAALTAKRKDLAIRLGIEAPDKAEVRDMMDVLQELLHNAEKDYEQADTAETKEFALNRINIWKNQIEALQAQRITLQLEVDPQGAKQTIQSLRRTKYSEAQTKANTVQSDLADGLIDGAEAQRQIKQINHDLETQIGKGFKPITLQVDTDEAEHGIKHFTTESRKAWSGITSGVDAVTSLTETLQGNGTVWEKLTAVVGTFFTVMDSVSAIMEVVNALTKVSTATKQADTTATETNTTTSVSNTTAKAGEALAGAAASGSSLPFPANIAAIAAAVAAVVAVIATISSLAFASGGIVPGTSYTGDRITARVNSGEMILNPRQQANLWRLANTPIAIPTTNAPTINPTTPTLNLAALRASLQAPSVNVNLSGRIRGRDIITVLANETRTNRRPTNIHI